MPDNEETPATYNEPGPGVYSTEEHEKALVEQLDGGPKDASRFDSAPGEDENGKHEATPAAE